MELPDVCRHSFSADLQIFRPSRTHSLMYSAEGALKRSQALVTVSSEEVMQQVRMEGGGNKCWDVRNECSEVYSKYSEIHSEYKRCENRTLRHHVF